MRKLKLQVQISVDGYVGGPGGELDWMVWDWDEDLKRYVNELTDSVDTILLGRNMTDGFMAHWTDIVKNRPDDPSFPFAKKMVDKKKIVFSKTLEGCRWENTVLAKGDLDQEVSQIKKQPGSDIIVYGGAGFVSALIDRKLIDELYLFVNPSAVGQGMSIFKSRVKLRSMGVVPFDCGIVLLKYVFAG